MRNFKHFKCQLPKSEVFKFQYSGCIGRQNVIPGRCNLRQMTFQSFRYKDFYIWGLIISWLLLLLPWQDCPVMTSSLGLLAKISPRYCSLWRCVCTGAFELEKTPKLLCAEKYIQYIVKVIIPASILHFREGKSICDVIIDLANGIILNFWLINPSLFLATHFLGSFLCPCFFKIRCMKKGLNMVLGVCFNRK